MFYSKSTGGFYDEAIHGQRRLQIIDPAWQRPTISVPDPEWIPAEHEESDEHPVITIPDPTAVPVTIEIDNLSCTIPADAVEITVEEHANLLASQAEGKRIVADASGRPTALGPTATEVKSATWEAIKAKRDAVKAGGVKVGTKWYHSDERSRTQYIGLLRMADAAVASGGTGTAALQHGGQDIQWKTMDGSFIKMTVQRANDVFNAVSGLDFVAFAAAETHKAAMEASIDPAAYDFSAGWPATFQG